MSQESKRNNSSVLKTGLTTVYVIFLVVAMIYKYKRPAYNWDMLPYMALVASMDNNNSKDIHAMVYREAKEHIPADAYRSLTDTSSRYRKRMASDPNFFFEKMPFYVVKPAYIGIAYLFNKGGFSLATSVFLPSVLSYFCIGLLIFVWLHRHLNIVMTTLVSIMLQLATPLLYTVSLATPDCLSAFFLLYSFYFLVEKKNLAWGYVLLLLAVLTRLDNILVAGLIVCFLVFSNKWHRPLLGKQGTWMITGLVGVYFIVAYGATLYGWNILFLPTFYQKFQDTYYSTSSHSIVINYLSQRHSALMISFLVYHLWVYLSFASLLFIGNKSLRWGNLSFDQAFMLMLILTIGARAVIYTDLGDRYFIAYFLVIPILLVRYINKLIVNSG